MIYSKYKIEMVILMKISINKVKPGMTVGTGVMKIDSPIILLNSDAVLTEKMIERLKAMGITEIDIKLTKDEEVIYNADKGVEPTLSTELFEDSKRSIKNLNAAQIIYNAKNITTSIIDSDEFKYSLSEYKNASDIFSHSVRVASFSVLLAKSYNDTLSSENQMYKIDLDSIAVAAMLHDIGKLCEDKNVLKSVLSLPNNLEKFFPSIRELNLQNYNEDFSSIYSYLLINNNPLIKADTKMMILLSNEDELGKSPLQPSENFIKSRQSFIMGAKIIKLCSMYDDELKYSISMNEPLENITAKLDYSAANNIVNDELEQLFMDHIPLYSKGVKVKLSNGKYAVILESFYGRMHICRPYVMTIPDNELIDLRNERSITIEEICNDEFSFTDIVRTQIDYMNQEIFERKK